jgi:5-methylcytosine-specific restriction endonuclease McrA
MEPLRKCNDCGLEAHSETDLELFTRKKNAKHGRALLCRKCSSARAKTHYENNTEYYQNWRNTKGKELHKKWRENNKDKVKESKQRYQKSNPAKMREKTMRYKTRKKANTPDLCANELSEIQKLYELACELTTTTGIKHEVDHILPISKGGQHVLSNLRVCTMEENRTKSDKIIPELINNKDTI